MKSNQLSNILCTLILLGSPSIGLADDFTSFIPGLKKHPAPSRKLPKAQAPSAKKVVAKLTDRQQCNKDLESATAPEPLLMGDLCVNNLEEAKSSFPEQYKVLSQMAGTWGDFHVGDYEEQIYERQQKTGAYDNDVPRQIIQNQLNFKVTSEGFIIQVQDFDEKAKVARTEPMKVQLCSSPSGFFFRSEIGQFPVKFKSSKCIWFANNGKWTAQRKYELPKDFEKSVLRSGVQ